MPGADGSIIIDTKILEEGFTRGISSLTRASAVAGKAIAAGIGTGLAAFTAFAAHGVQVASDLQEVQNVVDVTFAKSADAVNAWAKEAAAAYGLSELAAKQMAGTGGAMLKSMGLSDDQVLTMSTDLAGLAGDFASFYNLPHEEAWEKIRSGIAGETEPLKQIGINMSVANLEAYALSEGITKSYEKMTEAEKAQLRYNYLMKVSADAQGDFARTSDSLANQQRILSMQIDSAAASLGSALIPAISDIMKSLLPVVEEAAPALAQMGTALGQLLSGDASGAAAFSEGLSSIVSSVIDLAANLLPGLVSAVANVIVAIAAQIPTLLPPLAQALIDGILTIAAALPSLLPSFVEAFTQVIVAIATALPALMTYLLDGMIALIDALIDALPVVLPALTQAFVRLISEVGPRLLEARAALDLGMMELIAKLIEGLPEALPGLLEGFVALITGVAELLPVVLPALVDAMVLIINALADTLPELIPVITDTLIALAPTFQSAMKAVGAALVQESRRQGRELVTGLWSGIDDKFKWLIDKLRGFTTSVTDKLKAFFGIKSPSTLFRDEIGVNLALGVGEGFEGRVASVFRAMRSSVDSEMGRFALTLAPSVAAATAPANQDNSTHITFGGQVQTFSEMIYAMDLIKRGMVTG